MRGALVLALLSAASTAGASPRLTEPIPTYVRDHGRSVLVGTVATGVPSTVTVTAYRASGGSRERRVRVVEEDGEDRIRFRDRPPETSAYAASAGGRTWSLGFVWVRPRVTLQRERDELRALVRPPLRGEPIYLQRCSFEGSWTSLARAKLSAGGTAVFGRRPEESLRAYVPVARRSDYVAGFSRATGRCEPLPWGRGRVVRALRRQRLSLDDIHPDSALFHFSVELVWYRVSTGQPAGWLWTYEPPDVKTARAAARGIEPNGDCVLERLLLFDRLNCSERRFHWFRRGVTIVGYDGDDHRVLNALQAVLGRRLAGPPIR